MVFMIIIIIKNQSIQYVKVTLHSNCSILIFCPLSSYIELFMKNLSQQRQRRSISGDRFIAVRSNDQHKATLDDKQSNISTTYSTVIDIYQTKTQKILNFSKSQDTKLFCNMTSFVCDSLKKKNTFKTCKIKQNPIRILDAPYVVNNFYYNPMDYSNNCLVIGLKNLLYNYNTEEISKVERFTISDVTSTKLHKQDRILYVGNSDGEIQCYQLYSEKCFRQIKAHYSRVGALQNATHNTFLSGGKDHCINMHDIRIKRHSIMRFNKHKGQICSLAMNDNYFASGGNDQKVVIWDVRKEVPYDYMRQHNGAIKCLKWCPWRSNLLISAGGHKDHQMIYWNRETSQAEKYIDIGDQATGIVVLQQNNRSIMTSHNDGRIRIWDYKTGNLMNKLDGHHGKRIISMVHNKTQNVVYSLGADETLRFWKTSDHQNQNEDECSNISYKHHNILR